VLDEICARQGILHFPLHFHPKIEPVAKLIFRVGCSLIDTSLYPSEGSEILKIVVSKAATLQQNYHSKDLYYSYFITFS